MVQQRVLGVGQRGNLFVFEGFALINLKIHQRFVHLEHLRHLR